MTGDTIYTYPTPSTTSTIPIGGLTQCTKCGGTFFGSHRCPVVTSGCCAGCTAKDGVIAELLKLIGALSGSPQAAPADGTGFDPSTCPCSPARGGSGICGCVLGSQTTWVSSG